MSHENFVKKAKILFIVKNIFLTFFKVLRFTFKITKKNLVNIFHNIFL